MIAHARMKISALLTLYEPGDTPGGGLFVIVMRAYASYPFSLMVPIKVLTLSGHEIG